MALSQKLAGTSISTGKALVLGMAAFGTAAVAALQHHRHSRRYPYSRRDDAAFDAYRGKAGTVRVPTPYHWLEHSEEDEVKLWVDAQNKVTDAHLATCADKKKIEDALTEFNNFEKITCPFRRGDRIFHFWNSGLLNHSILRMQENKDAPIETLLDPNTFAADGTSALGGFSISEQGAYLAYAVSDSGSDWCSIRVRDVATKCDLPDEKLEWVKFSSISFDRQERGFFYCRYPPPASLAAHAGMDAGSEVDAASGQALYYHRLRTPQSADRLVCAVGEHPSWMFGAEVTECGRWAVVTVSEGCDPVNKVWLLDMSAQDPAVATTVDAAAAAPFQLDKIIDTFEAGFDYIGNDEHVFYFKTNHSAPRYRLVAIDIQNPQPEHWRELVPQHAKDVLNWVACVGGAAAAQTQLLCCHTRDVKEVLTLRPLQGAENNDRVFELPLPGPGEISGVGARRKDKEFFYSFTSFTHPAVIFHHSLDVTVSTVWREVTVGSLDPKKFQVRQLFYPSKDGTKIPMFVIARADAVLDGTAPCLLYGYGGFNIPLMPNFSASRLLWVQNFGGVYVVANLRGGGEYGEDWHKAGSLLQKQNVFDDFQAAAEYLVVERYTSAARIAIQGGSNGGLLVGACINQRPELFGCAVAQVGVMDMLKFHRFTIGYAWKSDYGDPDTAAYFDYVHAYSPLHNVDATKTYPPTLLCTADHDDRVVPNHSYKYIAELQYRLGEQEHQRAPLLIKIETKAGHGAGKPLKKRIEETAAVFAFMADAVGAKWRDQ